MADFTQTGGITTLQNLRTRDIEDMVEELKRFSKRRPTALCLPSLYTDLFSPAMDRILKVLEEVTYITQVIISVDRANAGQFEESKERIKKLPQEVKLIWVDGKRIQGLFSRLERHGLETGGPGKGRAVWIAVGYAIASGRCSEIILHDCDIVTYDLDFVSRLCWPLMNPHLGFDFVKGYYARVSDKLNGRVMRLFVVPLVNAMIKIIGHHPLLEYYRQFRYPLAGEFGMSVELGKALRIPYDWGIEVSVLAEVFRSTTPKQVCQIELTDKYDHKHQDLSAHNPEAGLMKMAIDIATAIFRNLATEGVVMTTGFFTTLCTTYLREAQNMVKLYHSLSELNGLYFDRHAEQSAVDSFANAVRHAATAYQQGPLATPLIANWNRVVAAEPNMFEELLEAVEEDNVKKVN
jgi:glucosyl-3-phosphoglycerate synthase